MVYLDSNVFLYPLVYDERAEPKAKAAARVLRDVTGGRVKGVSSALTWDEVVWVVWRVVGYDEAVKAGSRLLSLSNVEFVEVSDLVLVKAQALVEKYGLKPRDSIHVATALLVREVEVVSDDEELDRVREIKRIPLIEP